MNQTLSDSPPTRQKKRRPRHWNTKIPEGPWDYIVIGSGMGGMVCAAMLSRMGRRVLVLEQHYVPGGFTHTFKRPHYEWDVGVHAVGEVTRHSMTGRLLHHLTHGRLEWASLGSVYDEFYYPDGFRIDFPDSPRAFRENLCEAFPNETRAIDDYLGRVRHVSGAMKQYYLARALPPRLAPLTDRLVPREANRLLQERTQDVLASLTDDPKLRAVFAAQWGYYGSPPSRSSFAMQALVVKHFMHGGYYPVGGSGAIAEHLLGAVADGGGWTTIRADVEEICIANGVVQGVRLRSGEEIRARKVVSAAGVSSTVQRMMPAGYREATWATSVAALPPAPAHVCLYLGFKGDIRTAGASAANKWFYDTWDTEADSWRVASGERPPHCDVLYCSFPSLKDPLHDPGQEQRHTGEVVTFVPWESFDAWRTTRWKRRGDDYDGFKEAMKEQLLEQLLEKMPGLRPMVDYAELSTPLSTDHFVRPVGGSIYGLEPTPARFQNRWLRPRAPVSGLFFAGSEVATVGVIGAMMGGVLAAASAEPLRTRRLFGQALS